MLTIDANGGDDSFINMKTGGMLAIYGDGDYDLNQFLGMVDGTDAIQYWNGSAWNALTDASSSDYSLQYYSSSHDISGFDVNGYTVLTVGVVPEPSSALLASLSLLGLGFIRRRRR